MSAVDTREIGCPHCGATNVRWDPTCWLCKQPLPTGASAVEAPILAEVVGMQPQFGLSTLLLVVTVACLCLGLVSIAPGLIVPLVAIVLPAIVRSVVSARNAAGPVSVGDKLATFAASLGLIVLIWIAGLVALGTACTLIVIGGAANNFDNSIVGMIIVATIFAVLATLGLMGWLLYITWPSKNKKK
jgi:hypothetical protein